MLSNQMRIVLKRVMNTPLGPRIVVYSSETLTKEEDETIISEYRELNGVLNADLAALRLDRSLEFVVEFWRTNATLENVRSAPWYEVGAEETLQDHVLAE